MANKVIVFALLCVALIAVVQSAPQYAQGEEPSYDEDDYANEPVKAHSSADAAASEDEFDPSLLSENFGTARDPGRVPHSPENTSQSDSSSASSEQ